MGGTYGFVVGTEQSQLFLPFGQLLCEQARPFPFLLPQTEPTESGYIYPKKARIKAPS